MKYTVILMLRYNSGWLSLDREQRNHFNAVHIHPIFARYQEKVEIRFFDAEAFSADVSDFAILTCRDLKDYYFLMEELRDTELFSREWVTLKGILIGMEDGYQEFERSIATSQKEA